MGYKCKLFALAAVSLLIAAALVSLAAFDVQRDQADDSQALGDAKDANWFADNGYIEIATDADLSKIGTDPAFPLYGKYYLADDITLPAPPVNEQNHTSIGSLVAPFTGIFDGNGHTIFGIETFGIGNSSERAAGLFAYVGDGAEIRELSVRNRVHDWNSSTYKYFGSIIGCVVTDANVKLTNCSSDAWVMTWYSSHPYSGGLIGASFGNVTITGCYNKTTSAVIEAAGTSPQAAAGGLIGLNAGTAVIKDSYNVGKVRSGSTVGGLIGLCTGSATIMNCYNTGYMETIFGDISSSDMVDGDLVNLDKVVKTYNTIYTGGIIAHATGSGSITIKECYNSGRMIVAAQADIYAGGIAGCIEDTVSLNITDCYNVGNFTLYSSKDDIYAAGILSYSETSVTVANCYTAGYIRLQTPLGTEITGSIVASCPAAKIYSCYFLEDQVRANGTVVNTFAPSSAKVDGNADSTPRDGHQGSGSKTQAEMAYDLTDIRKGLSIYHIDATGAVAGWDFEHIWTIVDGVNKGFPVFGVSPVIEEGPIGGGDGEDTGTGGTESGTDAGTGTGTDGPHYLWLLVIAAAALMGLFLLGFLLRRKNCIEVEIIDEQVRTGSQITPTPWVRYRGRLLKAGEDMLYEYADNIEAGFGIVIIKLIGNYSGVVTVTFLIVEE